MKKNRPGVLLSVFCRAADVDRLEAILLDETPTLGVRRWPATRRKLERSRARSEHAMGADRRNAGLAARWLGEFYSEFETCRRVASEKKIAVRRVIEAAARAFDPQAVQRSN